MAERGYYKSRAHARQLVTFQNMRFGNITPTDIDVFMDFQNRLFIIGETKYGNADLPFGQRLAIERMCDSMHSPPNRWAVAFILHHNTQGDIDVAETLVSAYRWNKEWRKPLTQGVTFKEGVTIIRQRMLEMESPLGSPNHTSGLVPQT